MIIDGFRKKDGIVVLRESELAKTYSAIVNARSLDIFTRFLTNRIKSIENQRRMDISYALASEDVRKTLDRLENRITLSIKEVANNIIESDLLNVVCDLCKARLANLKGKKLIITSLGLKVAKKLRSLND